MEGERLGRVVAVALLALLTPVACAALGVCTPSASGLPPSSGSASPAVPPDDGEEASTTNEAFQAANRVLGGPGQPTVQTARERSAGPRVRSLRPTT
jgi:hypothetical protein